MNNPKYFSITYDMSKLSDDEQKAVIAEASSLFSSQKAVCAGWESGDIVNNGWISVDDELPKQKGYYLIYCFDHFDEQHEIQIEYFSGKDFNADLDVDVLYWQPLPNPPKE